ncbi:MAG: aldose epimerase family protein [Pseudomonadota bacterium]
MHREAFGIDAAGAPVERATLRAEGMTARVMTWGAVLQELRLDGIGHALTLGFPRFEDYPAHSPDFGSVVGPVANRIRGGAATVGGVERRFDLNCLGRHTLHGGRAGTGKLNWRMEAATADEARLALDLADGHMGFPGPISIRVAYRIEPGPSLVFEAEARAEVETVVNLAHHSYFALDGPGSDARDQILSVDAARYLPVDEDLCPTGEVRSVESGPFDFRAPRPVGRAGYDHNFCLSDGRVALRPVGALRGPASGVAMTIETTEPGLQVYDGSSIPSDGPPGRDGARLGAHAGLALEPQRWPDAPNQAWSAQAALAPGALYRQTSVFRFS